LGLFNNAISNLESSAVLSEPETRVRKVEVYADDTGNETDTPTPGSKKVVTYQRERVFRRQTIKEKIDDALPGEAESAVTLRRYFAPALLQLAARAPCSGLFAPHCASLAATCARRVEAPADRLLASPCRPQ
jgi:hypothetical protein